MDVEAYVTGGLNMQDYIVEVCSRWVDKES